MKFSIKSSIISSLRDFLKDFDENKEYKFLFGKKTHTSFLPYINFFDYEKIKNSLNSSSYIITQTDQRKYSNIIDIGIINNYYVTFGSLEEEPTSTNCLTYISPDSSHSILLLDSEDKYQIQVSLIKKPNSLTELFEPVKVIYRFIENFLVKDENQLIVYNYNRLFGKEGDKPWIVPQGLSYIKESNLYELQNCIIYPMRRGKNLTLFLCESGGYLFEDREIYKVHIDDVPELFWNTVVCGDWFENCFYAYDTPMFGGTDIRRLSLIKRLKYIKIISQHISFCKAVSYTSEYTSEYIQDFLKQYRGIIFAPIRANYTNNRTYIYQSIENVRIYFKISHNNLRYKTFTLKTGKEESVFSGNSKYPFLNTIPLSKEDREFIGINDGVFEFKWIDNNFIPISYSSYSSLTNTSTSKSIWTYINEPIDIDLILSNLN